jgi:chromosome segregation ATPase
MSDNDSTHRRRQRDPRLESSPPAAQEETIGAGGGAELVAAGIGRSSEVMAARIAVLESAIARLKEERAADADDLAAMLVRVADAERDREAAEDRATRLGGGLRELEAKLGEARSREPPPADQARVGALLTELERQQTRAAELEAQLVQAEAAAQRAGEGSAAALDALRVEHAATLDALRLEHAAGLDALRAEQNRAIEVLTRTHEEARATLETRLAEITQERETGLLAQMSALREEHAASKRHAARTLEEERSAGARARKQAAAAAVGLAAAREAIASAVARLEEIDRREEIAAGFRRKAIQEARQGLVSSGATAPPQGQAPVAAEARPAISIAIPGEGSAGRKLALPGGSDTVEIVNLEELEIDLAE